MNTEITRKLVAVAATLAMNGLILGSVAYLFNGEIGGHAQTMTLAGGNVAASAQTSAVASDRI